MVGRVVEESNGDRPEYGLITGALTRHVIPMRKKGWKAKMIYKNLGLSRANAYWKQPNCSEKRSLELGFSGCYRFLIVNRITFDPVDTM